MTLTERAIVSHWRGIAVLCAFVALFGIAWATWDRVDESDRMYSAAIAEADRRGDAVSTLAGDVRALREQIKASGETPVAPDPEDAVDDLPDRSEVPVPIPGPAGLPGEDGADGRDGEDGADSIVPGPAGPVGAEGEDGADSTVPGPMGPVGPVGPAGADGEDGADGQSCPTGYALKVPSWDPDALVCKRDGSPDPGGEPAASPMAALPPDRRRASTVG